MKSWAIRGSKAALAAAVLAVGLIGPAVSAQAGAEPAGSSEHITLAFSSDPNDFVGRGSHRFFDSGVDDVTAPTLTSSSVTIAALDPTYNLEAWTLHLAAPTGQRLAVGTYGSYDPAEAAANGVAELSLDLVTRGCVNGSGTFTVLDIASAGSTVTRLDVLFEQHCGGLSGPASFGELRMNEPTPATTTVSRHTVTWPATPLGVTSLPAAVDLENTSDAAESIGFGGADGAAAASFAIRPGSCGDVLLARSRCALSVTFTPLTAGVVTSSFEFAVGGNPHFVVALVGTTGYGATAATFVSQPGDPVGQGIGAHAYTTRSSTIQTNGQGAALGVNVYAADGGWSFTVSATNRDLEPGIYQLSASPGRAVDFAVTRDGRRCRTQPGGFISIRQVELTAVSHVIARFDATFSQTCAGAKGALTGRIALNSTPTVEQAVAPVRVLDTRSGTGAHRGRIPAHGVLTVSLATQAQLRPIEVSGAVLNVMAISPRAAGYLNIGSGSTRSQLSNVNFRPGQTVGNLATVPLGPSRTVTLYNNASAPLDVVLDLQARLVALTAGIKGALLPLPAVRVADTRIGLGVPHARIAAHGSVTLDLRPYAIGPGGAMSAALVNLTVPNASRSGYLSAYATGVSQVATSISFNAGTPSAGATLAAVGPDGRIRIVNGAAAAVDVIVDLQGYYTSEPVGPDLGLTSVVSPAGRSVDTRTGIGLVGRKPVPPGGSIHCYRIGDAGIFSITVLNATGHGNVSVSLSRGVISHEPNVTFDRGQTRTNLLVTQLNGFGLTITNNSTGSVDVILDSLAGLNPPTEG